MKCTLHIKDEVNIRFEGVDAATRRKLTQSVEFFMPHAYYTPAYKLGRWNGKTSFCDVGGRSYFHLLDKLLPIVMEHGYEIDIRDDRTTWDLSFGKVEQTSYEHIAWPEKHPAAGMPILLRDYQVDIVNRFLDNPQSLQQIATGAGKTLITAVLSHQCEKLGRSIVIVPNKDLVVQTERDYKNMGLDVGVLFGDRKEYTKTHTIATWQSIESLMKDVKKGNRLSEMENFLEDQICVMVDEVHKAKADVLRNQLSTLFKDIPIRWGLTGTVPEAEHEAMACTCALGPVIGQLTSKELQDIGVLSNLDVSILQLQDGILGFNSYAQELKWLVTDPARIAHLSEIINSYAQNGNTLVLIDRLATGDAFAEMNPDWSFVSGATKQKNRQKEYDEVSDADNKVIVATYGVAAVGINIPRIFNLIMLEPGKSYVRVVQSIGRGIRKAADKDYVQIVDITSNLKYSKRHLTKRKKYYADQQFPYKVTKIEYK